MKEDKYFIMTEMNGGNKVRDDYVHKICWNKFCQQLDGASSSLVKSNYLLNALGKQMGNMGMLPETEYKV